MTTSARARIRQTIISSTVNNSVDAPTTNAPARNSRADTTTPSVVRNTSDAIASGAIATAAAVISSDSTIQSPKADAIPAFKSKASGGTAQTAASPTPSSIVSRMSASVAAVLVRCRDDSRRTVTAVATAVVTAHQPAISHTGAACTSSIATSAAPTRLAASRNNASCRPARSCARRMADQSWESAGSRNPSSARRSMAGPGWVEVVTPRRLARAG